MKPQIQLLTRLNDGAHIAGVSNVIFYPRSIYMSVLLFNRLFVELPEGEGQRAYAALQDRMDKFFNSIEESTPRSVVLDEREGWTISQAFIKRKKTVKPAILVDMVPVGAQ